MTGYPKSGTTWVTHLMARLAGLHYEQRRPNFRMTGVALHTHSVSFSGTNNLLYVVRDPRESVCSAARAAKARDQRGVFDEDGTITSGFVAHAITALPGALRPLRDHLQTGIDSGWTYARFENLKKDAQAELERLNQVFQFERSSAYIAETIEIYDFERQRERNKGNVFFAQSSLSSWKTLLKPASLDVLEREVGKQALAFGYDLSTRS